MNSLQQFFTSGSTEHGACAVGPIEETGVQGSVQATIGAILTRNIAYLPKTPLSIVAPDFTRSEHNVFLHGTTKLNIFSDPKD